MADLSNYAENAAYNHMFGLSAWTMPAAVYVALYTAVTDAEAGTGTEVTGGDYARTAVTMGAPTNGAGANSAAVNFPTPSANWGLVTHFAFCDAATVGNRLSALKALTVSKTINTGDTVNFPIGALTWAFA